MRLLIISPHFPPTNAADMQRVRLILPYLKEEGWETEVLAVHSEQVLAPVETWLAEGLPPDVPVHRVTALNPGWGQIPGLGALSFRALGALGRTGDTLLKNGQFDLIYFSTTQFGVHALGPRWKRRFGVPFVMDYQDPWVNDYYREHPQVTPPGGRLRFAVADRLNRWMEPRVLRRCAGITSVSPDYPPQLKKRYQFLPADWPVEVLPFPGDDRDLKRVESNGVLQTQFAKEDRLQHWVYIGRGGADMHTAIQGLFKALQEHGQSEPHFLESLRLHFIGTSYASAGGDQKTVEPQAANYGLSKVVSEHPDRIPYSQTLRCLLDADALVVPGSDDPTYTASKIYPYLLARKPMLAIFHEQSSIVSLLHSVAGGVCIPFRTGEPVQALAARIRTEWLEKGLCHRAVPLDLAAFEPFTARASAKRLVAFFNQSLILVHRSR